uniref:Xyloglucan endotransglucosylase-hydrolase XTH6 n=1 Tax=Solanum tuberosum TaxID=4113 RepID=M1DBT5_SOLTU
MAAMAVGRWPVGGNDGDVNLNMNDKGAKIKRSNDGDRRMEVSRGEKEKKKMYGRRRQIGVMEEQMEKSTQVYDYDLCEGHGNNHTLSSSFAPIPGDHSIGGSALRFSMESQMAGGMKDYHWWYNHLS